eukprot:GHVQ01036143.1.p1 GENE.GHVQ01036143.1~~GHVQ01036143.1.p1  ORF type:complete len:331 (+),score=79.86 GHVQ01036143.1:339-1331(+)
MELSCTDQETYNYELLAVVVHIGKSMSHGHYICCIRTKDHWLLFDDHQVQPIDESELQNFFGASSESEGIKCGYLLFYKAVEDDRPPPEAVPQGSSVITSSSSFTGGSSTSCWQMTTKSKSQKSGNDTTPSTRSAVVESKRCPVTPVASSCDSDVVSPCHVPLSQTDTSTLLNSANRPTGPGQQPAPTQSCSEVVPSSSSSSSSGSVDNQSALLLQQSVNGKSVSVSEHVHQPSLPSQTLFLGSSSLPPMYSWLSECVSDSTAATSAVVAEQYGYNMPSTSSTRDYNYTCVTTSSNTSHSANNKLHIDPLDMAGSSSMTMQQMELPAAVA